jgi:hypothetical protein
VSTRRIVALLAAGIVLVAGTLVSAAAPSSADAGEGTPCVTGHWPADVQGKPQNLHRLGETGLYVWHDDSKWHLVVTHPDKSLAEFKGKVTTDGRLYGIARRTERRDRVVFAEDADGVHFKFRNYGGFDGIDFKTRCANRLTFDGELDGQPLKFTEVFIGQDAHHPGGVPFVIKREG